MVIKGYGHLVFWPFAILVFLLAVASKDFTLGIGATIWAVAMAALGARAPYLVFVCFYQAVMGMSGAAYMGIFGRYPGDVAIEFLVPRAVLMLLVALFTITVTYCLIVRRDTPGDPRLGQAARALAMDPRTLFFVMLVLFSLEWMRLPLQPSSTGGLRQIVLHVVNFRYVIFGLFLINVLRSNRPRHYLLLAIISLYIALPLATTGTSGWAGIATTALVFTAGSLTFATVRGGARMTPQAAVVGSALAIFVAVFGLIWEGGMKYAWRTTLSNSGQMSAAASLSVFADQTQGVLQNFDMSKSLELLSARMSSGIGFSSYVLYNVPRAIPFAQGERSLATLQNLVPRIFYPGKPDLGGDSWLIRKYANQRAAGDESGTSIGMGYVPELYIDFGLFGVVGGSIFLGLVFGLSKRVMLRLAPNPDLANACLAITLLGFFLSPDASLVKMVSSLVYSLVVFTVLAYIVHRFFYVKYVPRYAPSEPAPAQTTRPARLA